MRDGQQSVFFEAEIEVTSAKARLVKPTYHPGKECWLPKSQTWSMEPSGSAGVYVFEVPKWWTDKEGIDGRS